LLLLVAAPSCASSYEYWMIPQILAQPGSPVVVVMNVRNRDVVTERHPFFGDPSRSVTSTTLVTSYQTLDVRNCGAGPVHRYAQAVDLFGWGDAPGELWVRRADDPDGVEPVGGGARLRLGPVPTDRWKQPPFVAAGMVEDHGVLRVWDLPRRAVRDIPFIRDPPLETILPARAGDANLVGLSRSPDRQSLDVLAVPLGAGGAGPPVTTHFGGRFREARLIRGGAWLALMPEAAAGGRHAPASKATTLWIVDVRTGNVVRQVDQPFDHGSALIEGERLWFAHIVDETCGRLRVLDLEANRFFDLALPGCAVHLEPWSAGVPFVFVDTRGAGRQLVDLRSGRMIPSPSWTPSSSAVIGNDYFGSDGPQDVAAVDVVTGRRRGAVTSIAGIRSLTAVPAARRLVIVDEHGSVMVYDPDANRVSACL
jgi:hypothetical protein